MKWLQKNSSSAVYDSRTRAAVWLYVLGNCIKLHHMEK